MLLTLKWHEFQALGQAQTLYTIQLDCKMTILTLKLQ